jgi:hypothetical protein
MSTLANGTEDLVGQNLTPAAAYAVANTAFQKVAQMQWHQGMVGLYGLVKDGAVRGRQVFPTDVQLVNVQIIAEGDTPVGSSFTCQLVVNGVTQSQVFSLSAGQTSSGLILPSSVIYVTAGQTAAVAVVNGNQSSDVIVYPTWQKVIQ